ncbi:hypothetical protein L7F22_009753 [Adiantum nelumboides]|nr:hypothetical protein [Adiantum nelumboides]
MVPSPARPDRSGTLAPLRRVDEGDAVGLGRGVVLVQDRTPPVDHRLLDVHRARRGRVDRDPHRGHVVGGADGLRELEHPHEHRRHPLRVGDRVPLDQLQGLLGVEALHHHDGAAERLHRGGEPQRRGVVQRGRVQVDGVGVEAVHRPEQGLVGVARLVDLPLGQRRLDALGAPGGARRVEHVGAARLVGRRFGRHRGEGLVVVGVARRPGDLTAEGQPHRGVDVVLDRRGQTGDTGRDDERLRAAVPHDVGRLGRGEVVVHRGDVEPRPLGGPVDLVDPRGVLRDERDDVAPLQTGRTQVVREPGGPSSSSRKVRVSPEPPMITAGLSGVVAACVPGYIGASPSGRAADRPAHVSGRPDPAIRGAPAAAAVRSARSDRPREPRTGYARARRSSCPGPPPIPARRGSRRVPRSWNRSTTRCRKRDRADRTRDGRPRRRAPTIPAASRHSRWTGRSRRRGRRRRTPPARRPRCRRGRRPV